MKLKLEKQKVISLSSNEMNNLTGGGEARSDRRTGNCRYSRNHPESCECIGNAGPQNITVGCVAS